MPLLVLCAGITRFTGCDIMVYMWFHMHALDGRSGHSLVFSGYHNIHGSVLWLNTGMTAVPLMTSMFMKAYFIVIWYA